MGLETEVIGTRAMISRVASNCFWMLRYIERAESSARMLRTNRAFVLDVELPRRSDHWYSLVIVVGEQERFDELHANDAGHDGEAVQEYLTWEERNPASLVSSVRWARENARTTREVTSPEMWETLNEFWHFLNSVEGRALFESDRDRFYNRAIRDLQLFTTLCEQTLLHDAPLNFMRLGRHLERAGQVARMIDVRDHVLEASDSASHPSVDIAQWMALLECFSAQAAFLKLHPEPPSGRAVADFLLREARHPFSVAHNLEHAAELLSALQPGAAGRSAASTEVGALLRRLGAQPIGDLVRAGLHDELTVLIDGSARVCELVQRELIDREPLTAAMTQSSDVPTCQS